MLVLEIPGHCSSRRIESRAPDSFGRTRFQLSALRRRTKTEPGARTMQSFTLASSHRTTELAASLTWFNYCGVCADLLGNRFVRSGGCAAWLPLGTHGIERHE